VQQSSLAFKANFTISTNTGCTTHSNLLPPLFHFVDDTAVADGCVLMMDDDESVKSRGGGDGGEFRMFLGFLLN
jgi:hypothetical protein